MRRGNRKSAPSVQLLGLSDRSSGDAFKPRGAARSAPVQTQTLDPRAERRRPMAHTGIRSSPTRRLATAGLALLVLTIGSGRKPAVAASHREAPRISLDPPADITDFFLFRSYEPGREDKVILIMNVFPGGEPSSGPNYFTFDPNVLYAFHIDNDRNGKADDVSFEFRFRTEIRGTVDQFNLFVSYIGCGTPRGPPAVACSPTGAKLLPPITSLDGPGSEGLGLRQSYSVTMVRRGQRLKLAEGLIAVPSNVGPSTTPSY